ncbi:MAG: glycosyltransferase family 2 protein [Phycisphaeraceae bacterium]
MTRPTFTIITPNLNNAAYLERTICSVLDQDYPDVEYIVADGGSRDDSLDIIERYADELASWRSEPDAGPAEAINAALARARGDIVGILPSDDVYLPHTLHEVADRLDDDAGPRWLVGDCVDLGPHDEQLGQVRAEPPNSLVSFLAHDSGVLPRAACFYRRELLDGDDAFDAHYRYAFDYDLHARLLGRGLSPGIASLPLAARHESPAVRSMREVLRQGREFIDVAARHARHLPRREQAQLARNCDERRCIYTLAEAEARRDDTRRILWQQLLRHPWWLGYAHYRRMLLSRDANETGPHRLHAA